MQILITGTSSGLGKELANQFSILGHDVTGISRRKSGLTIKEIFIDLEKIIPKDLAVLQNSNFDYVILNAGVLGKLSKIKELTEKNFESCFKINVLSNKTILDVLLPNIKNVIGISSGAANKPYFGWSLYCTSKAAFKQLLAVYAEENEQTHFLSLAPGIIKTPMQDYIFSQDETKIKSVKKFKDMYHTMDTPDVVAKKIIKNLSYLKDLPSGSFFDLRKL